MATASKPKAKKKSKWTLRRTLLWTTIIAGTAAVCALIGYMIIIYSGQNLLKNVDPNQLVIGSPSTIYDVNNQLVTTLTQQKSDPVEFKDIPPMLINAVIATEDRRFNDHTGVDFISIGRAIVKDIVNRSAVEGASTITQQLAKNILFDHPQKTLLRKATELSLALALENKYSKNEIITMYLNRINFGSGAYGVKTAAKRYFGKDLKDLELWQMATLAAIPKSPTNYSPIAYPDKSKERRQVVLKLMNEQGYITTAERDAAMQVNYVPPKQNLAKKEFLTFIDYTVEEAQTLYNISPDELYRGGYKIYTTMNTNAQRIMEQTYANDNFFQKGDAEQEFQSSMVITDYKTGGIVAMIGGRDYVNKGLNRVTVPQQPGSSFKPLVVYAPAIETGNWNQYSMLNNEKTNFNGYSPRNYDNNYTGQVSMYEAVKKSINLPAVWLLNQIKLNTGMNFAKNLGITFKEPNDDNLAIALGGLTIGETPLQMAQAYGSFANNGAMNKSHAIVKITLGDKELVSFKQEKAKQVMSPKTAYYTTQLLKGVVEPGGTGATARMDRPVAGKTGSTQLTIKGYEKFTRDLWFVGYTPEWSAAIWMGYDKPDTKHYVTIKSDSAATLFKEVMSKALANVPVTDFVKPNGVPDLKAPPQPLSDLTAVYDAASNKVNLNWTAVADPSVSYRVYRKASQDADFALLLEVKDNVGVSDLTLTAGETYQYYVTAYSPDSQTESNKSNVVELAVPAADASPTPSASISPSPGDGGLPTDSGSPSPTPDGTSPTPTPTPEPTNSAAPTATPTPSATPMPVVGQTPKPPAAAGG